MLVSSSHREDNNMSSQHLVEQINSSEANNGVDNGSMATSDTLANGSSNVAEPIDNSVKATVSQLISLIAESESKLVLKEKPTTKDSSTESQSINHNGDSQPIPICHTNTSSPNKLTEQHNKLTSTTPLSAEVQFVPKQIIHTNEVLDKNDTKDIKDVNPGIPPTNNTKELDMKPQVPDTIEQSKHESNINDEEESPDTKLDNQTSNVKQQEPTSSTTTKATELTKESTIPGTNKQLSQKHSESETDTDTQQDTSVSSNHQTGTESQTGRTKRQRRQTQLFQIIDIPLARKSQSGNNDDETSEYSVSNQSSTPSPVKRPRKPSLTSANNTNNNKKRKTESSPSKKTSTSSLITNNNINNNNHSQLLSDEAKTQSIYEAEYMQDVIHYEKNDYLAVRNEHNTFYLSQLMETVRSVRPMMKVRWLDTNDEGKTYYLTGQYDKVPQKSVIMPVDLNKLKSDKKGDQLFSLSDEVRQSINERLERSLLVSSDTSASSQI